MLISIADSNVWAYEQLLNINPRIGVSSTVFRCMYIQTSSIPCRFSPDFLADVIYHRSDLTAILDMAIASRNLASKYEGSAGSRASVDIAGAGTHSWVSIE
jgi:hypothetical protein